MICERCHTEAQAYTLSMFDNAEICLDCKALERGHPQYPEAQLTERAEVERGNLNFPGIGKPADL